MKVDLRYLARSLLNRNVKTLDVDTKGLPVESPCRLEEFLNNNGEPTELADMGTTGDPCDPQVQARNATWRREYKALLRALKDLAKTGHIDRAALRQGEELLPAIIEGVLLRRDSFRYMLDPSDAEVAKHADHVSRANRISREEATRRVTQDGYEIYLTYSNVAEALETLRGGLQAMNEALDKQPGGGLFRL